MHLTETIVPDKKDVVAFLQESVQNIADRPALQTFNSCFSWADHFVRVVLVGVEDTRFFTDAIFHRFAGEAVGKEELTIYVVDDKVAADVLPAPFWQEGDFDMYGRLLDVGEDNFVEYTPDKQVLVMFSRSAGVCVIWARNVAGLPGWERSFPFRSVLFQWFKNSRYLFVHAGAVGYENGGVLLTGKGGMGKSTATLSCLDSDLRYAGDDFVMIDTETLEVHSLYSVANLELSNLHRFPKLAPLIANPDSLPHIKRQLFLYFIKPASLINSFKVKAIFLPRFLGREETIIRQASKGEALLALMPSTIGLLRADTQVMGKIAAMIQKLPCFWIETGTNLEKIPQSISSWLNSDSHA